MEGGWCRLEVPEERLGWEALGEDVEKQWPGDLNQLSPTPIPTQPLSLRGAGPSQQPQLGKRQMPHPRGYSPPHPQNPPATPCILTPEEERAAKAKLWV